MKKITAKDVSIYVTQAHNADFISLTDMARYRDEERSDYIIQNWMRNRSTIEFIGIWETIHNPSFKSIEFDGFKNEAGSNSFSLTPKKWIETTNATGLITRKGKYGGGTFAHADIALEFAGWLSPEFKLYVIKEFQRLKDDESTRQALGWDTKRTLAKINYRIHTDAIKQHIIPAKLSATQAGIVYANEADVLNKALFGMTAKEWRTANPKQTGNIRDYAEASQLVCLSNLESLNAEFIRAGYSQPDRLIKLNESAIIQMKSLAQNRAIQALSNLTAKQERDK